MKKASEILNQNVSDPGQRPLQENPQGNIPGIGVSGLVMCPFGFQRMPCFKHGCELWVELNYDKKKVGRCSLSWSSILATEITQQLVQLNKKINSKENPTDANKPV